MANEISVFAPHCLETVGNQTFEHKSIRRRIDALFFAAVLFCPWLSTGADAQQPVDQPFNRGVRPGDWPQLGGTPHRNNTPEGRNIPTEWDVTTGKNIKWSVPLGSQSYGNVVVANGQIYVGTNNGAGYVKRYPKTIDLGVLLCLRESDGKFLWQHSSPKLPTGRVHDWEYMGICSAPVVEDDRLWFVTNRGEVVCLDTKGFYDDEDDGPVSGVWSRLFEAVPHLGNWAESSKNGEMPLEYQSTLRLIVQVLDSKVGVWFSIKTSDQPNNWVATTYANPPKLFTLALTQEALTITGLNGSDKEIQIDPDLLAGLDEGHLSRGLRLLFASSGIEMAEDASPTAIQPGQSWTVTADVAGTPTTFRLRKDKGATMDSHRRHQ